MKWRYFYLYCCIIIYICLIKFIHGQIQINNKIIRRLALSEDITSIPTYYNPDSSNFNTENAFDNTHSTTSTTDNSIPRAETDFTDIPTFSSTAPTADNTIPRTETDFTDIPTFSSTAPTADNSIPRTETDFTDIPTFSNTISTTDNIIPRTETDFTDIPTSPNTISTTDYNIPSTGINFTDIPTSPNTISTTDYNIPSTGINFTNIPTSPNTISTTDYNIPSTGIDFTNLPTETSSTTELVNIYIVLLGFSHLKKSNSYISFYIYFICKEGYEFSNNLNFPVQINYDNNKFLRLLESENKVANCRKDVIKNQKISYFCLIEEETQNINNIKIIPDFNFISQESNVEISPFASDYMNNIVKIGNQFDFLLNSNLYILSHPKLKAENNKKIFNISGVINEPNAKFQKNELSLIALIESKKGNEEKTELNCKIIDVIINNYIIQCEANEYGNYSLFNAISIIENDILFINFDNIENSKISIPKLNSNVGGLDAVSVIAIIIILIFFGYFI